jgi:hypothetical protein
MFRLGGRLVQKNATAVKMAKGNVQELLIPVPWGHIAGRIVVQKYDSWNSQETG